MLKNLCAEKFVKKSEKKVLTFPYGRGIVTKLSRERRRRTLKIEQN